MAQLFSEMERPRWVVSYDDVDTIRSLYEFAPQLGYMLRYSARRRMLGREVLIL